MRSRRIFTRLFTEIRPGRINRRLALLAVALLSLNMVTSAYAGATFTSITGPVWQSPDYVFSVTATLTNPEKYVCVSYAYNSGAQLCADCVGVSPNWTCSIPEMANSSITWGISAYPNSKCGGGPIPGGTGSFTTGPTAVKLASFTTTSSGGSGISSGSILFITVLGAGIFLIAGFRIKRARDAE